MQPITGSALYLFNVYLPSLKTSRCMQNPPKCLRAHRKCIYNPVPFLFVSYLVSIRNPISAPSPYSAWRKKKNTTKRLGQCQTRNIQERHHKYEKGRKEKLGIRLR